MGTVKPKRKDRREDRQQGFIGWLDLRPDDISATRKFLAAFGVEDTIDALGFQPVSDVFANKFYPAVTTPMTRARYFIFVPALYRLLGMKKLGEQELRRETDALQVRLRRILMDPSNEGRKKGVIGKKRDEID